jgi:hypothetical protein
MEMDHRRVSRVKIKSVKPAESSRSKKKPAPSESHLAVDSAPDTPQDLEPQPRKEIAKARRAASTRSQGNK